MLGLRVGFDGEEDFPEVGEKLAGIPEGFFTGFGFEDNRSAVRVAHRREGNLDRGKLAGVSED